MPQSLSKIYLHLIFSTKDRQPLITPEIKPELNAYMGGILNKLECQVITLESVADHVHALFMLSRTVAVSKVIEEVKKGSSLWIKQRDAAFADFYWQAGYGAFSVSESVVPAVVAYIRDQETHHQTKTFQEEYREFLIKHKVSFDERYVWD